MNKNNIVYQYMAKYRIKFLIINILVTALYIVYIINKLPYLKTAWFGPSELDVAKFVEENQVITIDSLEELTRKDREHPDGSYLKKTSYWQGDKYRFTIKADSLKKTDKKIEGKATTPSGDVMEIDMYTLYIAEIGGKKAAVLAFSDQKVDNEMTASIVHMQKSVRTKLSEITQKEGAMEFYDCIIDVRGLEMEAETSDHTFFWFYLVGLMYLWIKLLIYYIKPIYTPTFRKLDHYGKPETVAEEIDRQYRLKSMRRNGKDIVLDGFILSGGFLRLKVVKNHTAKN